MKSKKIQNNQKSNSQFQKKTNTLMFHQMSSTRQKL